jgi:hypothetical protein
MYRLSVAFIAAISTIAATRIASAADLLTPAYAPPALSAAFTRKA